MALRKSPLDSLKMCASGRCETRRPGTRSPGVGGGPTSASRSETACPLCSVSGGDQPESDSGKAPSCARAAPQTVCL